MTVLKELISIDPTSETPIYRQIAKEIIREIRRGRLSRGAKLPGTGTLAGELGFNRKTLQAAYDELMAEGWIEILPRKGSFVVTETPEILPRTLAPAGLLGYPATTSYPLEPDISARFPRVASRKSRNLVLDGGLPDVRLAPIAELIREYRNLSKQASLNGYLGYGEPAGSHILIETLVEFLRETRALPISRENVIITRGAQMAFHIAAKVLLRPGDRVAIGTPGYVNIEVMLRRLDAVVHRIPVDPYGIDLDHLEWLCRKTCPRIVYVLPHHHYPTNATLIPERRIRLLELAIRHRFAIIEDDFDYDFEYDSGPFLPMASLDERGSVIYVGTLAKTLFPSMRVGFLVAPAEFVRAALEVRRSIDLQGDSMMEAAIAGLFKSGAMKAHIRKAVKTYRERRDHMSAALLDAFGERISFEIPTGGMGFWARIARSDLDRVSRIAYEKGLTIGDRLIFNPGDTQPDRVRLGFTSLDLDEQDRAVDILKASVMTVERTVRRT